MDVVSEWYENKRRNDNCPPDLWRVHDNLYDLEKFAETHPGGKSWILENRGTDITELFESHHIDIAKARLLLQKYLVKKATGARNSQYTFHTDGFYSTLKNEIFEVWKTEKNNKISSIFTLYSWFLLVCVFAYYSLINTGNFDHSTIFTF